MLEWLRKPLLITGALIGGTALTVTIGAYFLQNKILYLPCPFGFEQKPRDNPSGYCSPADRSIPYEEFVLQTEDRIKLSGWFMHQPERRQVPTILFMHENAGNIGYRMDLFQSLYEKLKVNIIAVSYRGYGYSEGSPSETGIQKDAAAMMKYTFEQADIDPSKVIISGRSLGGAVAIYSLSAFPQYKARGLILENTFTSIPDMVDTIMPKFGMMKWLLRNRWDSEKRIAELKVPILFISGDSDTLVPPAHMRKLFEATKSATWTQFTSVAGGSHNDTWAHMGDSYFSVLSTFISQSINR